MEDINGKGIEKPRERNSYDVEDWLGLGGTQYAQDKPYDPYSYGYDKFLELGGHQIADHIKEQIKQVVNPIVPFGSNPTEETLELARNIMKSEIRVSTGGDLFFNYIKVRFKQLTNPELKISPREKAALFEEMVTIVAVIDDVMSSENKNKPYYQQKTWDSKMSIEIGKDTAMSVPDIMKMLYLNRDKYGLPNVIHLPQVKSKNPWGVLDPNRTPETCPVMPLIKFFENSSIGTAGLPINDLTKANEDILAGRMNDLYEEQKQAIKIAEDEFVNAQNLSENTEAYTF